MGFEPPEQPETDEWARPSAPPPPAPPAPGFAVADLQPVPPARRRWPLAGGVVVVVAAAIAIPIAVSAGGHGTKTPLDVLSAASGETTASGSARVSSVETISGQGESVDIMRIEGATDWAHKTSSLTMSARGSTVMEMRSIAGVSYMSSPASVLPGGAHWVAIRPSDLNGDAGTAVLGTNDPASGLKFLSALHGDPKVVGTETIDGVHTTHYTFTIDFRKVLDQMSKAARAIGSSGTAGALGSANGAGLDELPGAAWIDEQGRVRRFEFTIEQKALGQTIKVVDVMTFSHFDEPVHVTKPSASDTAPFSSLSKLLESMSAGIGQPTV